MTVTHRKNRHWATLKSRWKVLRLLWKKSWFDWYEIKFSDECLKAPTDAYNKILGTSKYLNPRKESLRLAWKPDGKGSIIVADMYEVDEVIEFFPKAVLKPYEVGRVCFTKSFRLPINTPYFGGNQTPNKTFKYWIG